MPRIHIMGGIHILPLTLFLLFPITFFGTYLAAVLEGHVEAEFPYISDVGTYAPESCVFGQLLNIAAVLLLIVIYIRYCEVYEYHSELQEYLSPRISSLNKSAVWLGTLASLGLSIVANFQETSVKYAHYVGALMCFGLGTAYFWIQAICSYHLIPHANSLLTAHFRVFLSMMSAVFFILQLASGVAARIQFHGKNPRKWYPEDGGWLLHVVSTASEWVVAVCFCVYIITFYKEFRHMTLSHPQVFLNSRQLITGAAEDVVS